jgi:hypothetical protein
MERESILRVEIEGASESELRKLYRLLNDFDAEWVQKKVDTCTIEIEVFEIVDESALEHVYDLMNDMELIWEEV